MLYEQSEYKNIIANSKNVQQFDFSGVFLYEDVCLYIWSQNKVLLYIQLMLSPFRSQFFSKYYILILSYYY